MDQSQYKELENLINKLVSVNGYQIDDKNIQSLRVDLLERALEIWRIKNKHLENSIDFEKFYQGYFSINNNSIHFSAPEKVLDVGAGTPPIRLQPKLLMFLLLYHKHSYSVYNIIENFIDKIWDNLKIPLDFKKTQTGVFRCFTNTRFAALTLRDYGLLKFTKKEAYKTWVLSLSGFLVASKILENRNWKIAEDKKEYDSGLHPEILTAFVNLHTYDDFVSRLTYVCMPNIEVFSTFDEVLRKAHALLNDYWQTIRHSNN